MTTKNSNIIIYQTEDGKASVSLMTQDGNVWMSQNQIAELFATSVPNISMHISGILRDKELQENSVVKDYLTTASDGKNYSVEKGETVTNCNDLKLLAFFEKDALKNSVVRNFRTADFFSSSLTAQRSRIS